MSDLFSFSVRKSVLLGVAVLLHCVLFPWAQPAAAQQPAADQAAQLAAQTVILVNIAAPGAQDLAQFYAQQRGIPETQIVSVSCTAESDISRADFDKQIREPLLEQFLARKWWTLAGGGSAPIVPQKSRVQTGTKRFLAVIRGLPFRITRSASGQQEPGKEDEASVDSELTLLGVDQYPLAGHMNNPLYGPPGSAGARAQAPPGLPLFVSRLDGPDVETVQRIITDGIETERSGLLGRAVIDFALKDGAYEQGEEWLRLTAKQYYQSGIPTYVDRKADLIPLGWPLKDTALYFGWYAGGVSGVFADPQFRFSKGAVACHLHSFSAATLRDPNLNWTGPLLMRGAAATFGNVWEPYLSLTIHFHVLNQHLLSGAALAEAAWRATPGLSWMTVVIGDPIYRPFAADRSAGLPADGNRDYALFQAIWKRHADAVNDSDFKSHIVEMAQARKNAHLLELLGLHVWQESQYQQAADLFENAASWYEEEEDRQRCLIYQGEALIHLGKPELARAVLKELPNHPATATLLPPGK
jgi:uncharacterized protein (TIGR03790 family)